MEQLNFFALSGHSSDGRNVSVKPAHWQLYVDGASRNNPGPAGAGIYLSCDGKDVVQEGYFLGSRTNNEAEYLALLLGVALACDRMNEHDTLEIFADSELMVKQVRGLFKVRKPNLQKLHIQVMRILGPVRYQIKHVRREFNAVADKLANQGVDKKKLPPEALQKIVPV